MEPTSADPAAFFHVRVIVGVVVGLAITRLLNGLARFVQVHEQRQAYGVHVAWALFLLLVVVHFWWFEFALSQVVQWTFETYAFLIFYAALHFLAAAILFPDRIDGAGGFATYFHDSRRWFFGLLIALFIVDLADTALKGMDHFVALGWPYLFRQGAMITLAATAIPVRDRRWHIAFVATAFAIEIWWILTRYDILTR